MICQVQEFTQSNLIVINNETLKLTVIISQTTWQMIVHANELA